MTCFLTCFLQPSLKSLKAGFVGGCVQPFDTPAGSFTIQSSGSISFAPSIVMVQQLLSHFTVIVPSGFIIPSTLQLSQPEQLTFTLPSDDLNTGWTFTESAL
jgi:hypothetical protein